MLCCVAPYLTCWRFLSWALAEVISSLRSFWLWLIRDISCGSRGAVISGRLIKVKRQNRKPDEPGGCNLTRFVQKYGHYTTGREQPSRDLALRILTMHQQRFASRHSVPCVTHNQQEPFYIAHTSTAYREPRRACLALSLPGVLPPCVAKSRISPEILYRSIAETTHASECCTCTYRTRGT